MKFPATIQARLLAWLVVPLLFMSGAHLLSTWVDTRNTSRDLFDRLLVTLALTISEHALATGGDLLTDDAIELIRTTTNDNLYYKVIGPGGAFVMGYEDLPEPPGGVRVLERNIQFYDASYLEQPVRVIAASSLVDNPDFSGWMTTFVAQTTSDREEYVASIMYNNMLRLIAMIAVASGLLLVGVAIGLRPLRWLRATVQERDPKDNSPLRRDGLPTEINDLVTELNHLLGRVAKHSELTKRFVADAAHQLRTPVTALLSQSELALRRAESEDRRNEVGKIRASARNIARLTNQLLNLTYAESVALTGHQFESLDLAKIGRHAAESFREIHPDANLELELESAPVGGIRLLLLEAIGNLLDNARKYAGVNAEIRLRTRVRNGKSFVEVIDNGPGIEAAEREKVLDRFYRKNSATPGSGLGLSIVREIVGAHSGQVEIHSGEGGEGTRASCGFPTSKTAAGAVEPPRA